MGAWPSRELGRFRSGSQVSSCCYGIQPSVVQLGTFFIVDDSMTGGLFCRLNGVGFFFQVEELPSKKLTYPPPRDTLSRWFPFPKTVGYLRFICFEMAKPMTEGGPGGLGKTHGQTSPLVMLISPLDSSCFTSNSLHYLLKGIRAKGITKSY